MMQRYRRLIPAAVGALALALLAGPVFAQGVTTAAVQGTVLSSNDSTALDGAVITVTNTSTGARFQATTRTNGRYVLENLPIGGPYTLEARSIGFEPGRKTGLMLSLGQRYSEDFVLAPSVVQLEELSVSANIDPLINKGRTGPANVISDSAIQRLPLVGRNFTDLIAITPLAVNGVGSGGPSVGGQNNRFNNIQIDGGVNNDLFGLAASGVPGGQAGAKAISVDAVQEFQVLVAPFDVRQGSFTGGLVNAVTKSGTNRLHGSLYGYLLGDKELGVDFIGTDSLGNKVGSLTQEQAGFTLGGPIIQDKLHFFVNGELQKKDAPFQGEVAGENNVVSQGFAQQVQDVVKNTYGFDPGGWQAPTLSNPQQNIFAKLNWQLGTNNQIELSHNFVHASDDNLIRNSRSGATNFRDGYQLSNSGYPFNSHTYTTRGKWTAVFADRYSNELLVGYSAIREKRDIANIVPLILVTDTTTGLTVAAGSDRFSQANSLDQDIVELTDNLTFGLGAHRITVGTHNEFFKFHNVFFPASLGVWNFNSIADLQAGTASRYEIALPGATRPDGPVADFKVRQYGVYVQDQFVPVENLTVTAGLRLDDPTFPTTPASNSQLQTDLGINTGNFPSGNILWSPRLGLNYDVNGAGQTVLRGGVGVFSGRPPYVWVSNAFTNTGLEQQNLVCSGAGQVPTFTQQYVTDPAGSPTTCAGGGGAVAPIPTINYFDPSFKWPQNLKVSLGVDQRLPWGMVGTVDLLRTTGLNSFYLTDVNVVEQGRNAEGRMLYGTASPSRLNTVKVTNNFRQVILHKNKSGDFSDAVSLQLQKRFSDGLAFNASYTWSTTRDYMSMTSSIASSNLNFSVLDGTLDSRIRRRSQFDIPHSIAVSGTVNLPYKFNLGVFWNSRSGNPFTYVIQGDANGDGISSNDIVYVPRDQNDISLQNPAAWDTLNAYINSERCLRDAKGHVLPRNTCRNSWASFVSARLTKYFTTFNGQSIEITADMFNVLNFLDSNWGVPRQTSAFEGQTLLRMTGYDLANDRPIYTLALPIRDKIVTAGNANRWRLQLGAKYRF